MKKTILIKYPHPEGLCPNAQTALHFKDDLEILKVLVEKTPSLLQDLHHNKYILNTPDGDNLNTIIWSTNKPIGQNLDELIEQCTVYLRKKFKELGTGMMGDRIKVKDNLAWFFETYPEYADFSIIVSATERYINATYSRKGIFRFAHYFIKKYDLSDRKTPTSDLSVYCEEVSEITMPYESGQSDDI